MVRLPAEYQEVEYLESTQSQYIDTNYIPNVNSEITIVFSDFSFINNDGGGQYRSPYGYWQSGASIQASRQNTSTTIYTSFGNRVDVSYSTRYGWKNVIRHVLSKDGVYENDTRMLGAYSSLEFNQATGSVYIFARNASGVAQRKVNMKLYSFTISENSEPMQNLIPCYRKSDNEPGMYDTVSKSFYTNSGTGTFLMGDPVYYDTASLLERRRQILLNTPHIETVSSSMASFSTDISTNLKECRVYFSPVQEGTGDPSPDNVRPITGWDGIEVSHNVGQDFYTYNVTKNLAADKTNISKINNNSFRLYTTSPFEYPSSKQLSTTLGFVSGKRYRIEFDLMVTVLGDGHHINFGFRNSSNSFQTDYTIVRCDESGHYTLDFTFTNTTNLNYLSLCQTVSGAANFDATISNLQIYEVETLIIPFNRTIYGGYVDLLKGEVVEEWVMKNVPTNDVLGKNLAGYNRELSTERYFRISISSKGGNTAIICNMAIKGNVREDNQITRIGPDGAGLIHYALPNNVVGILSTDIPDERNSKIIDWLSNNQMVVIYDIKTPNTYALTPETIKALKGVNNIWSNANGNVEVSYYSH